jgi:hypothetical protein
MRGTSPVFSRGSFSEGEWLGGGVHPAKTPTARAIITSNAINFFIVILLYFY